MRVRLKLDNLRDLMARGNLSQNHWAIKIGISRGHWSEIVNGKHLHLSPKTRTRMVEVFGVSFDDLFEIEPDAPGWSDPTFHAAISDRYLIDEEVGQGGMGTVYLARDVKLGRQVAIKVVTPESVSGIGTQQFLKEARYTAQLQHQNILGLYDAGEAAGHPYYVMPFVRAGSLRQLLERRGRLPLDEVLHLARGIAKALQHAHENHVLHCDVKPENILLADDHVYVADFGISRAIHAEVLEWGQRPEFDSSAGTPAYVSPEHASGDQNLDARADVYSFACVVFEMLAGRPPFTGRNTMEIVSQRFTTEVPDLTSFAPEIPRAVVRTLERAMALAPAQRTNTAMGLLEEMESASRRRSGIRGALHRARFAGGAALRHITGGRTRSPRLMKGRLMENALHDTRQAIRTLRRVPVFTLMTILTLALGIGANAAIFTIVNAVLLQPLPYDRPDELAMIWEHDREGQLPFGDGEMTVAPANYVRWLDRAYGFADMAAFNIWGPTLSHNGQVERVVGSVVTPNLFRLLGVTPLLGTGFSPEHAVPGNDAVVVLGYGLWQTRFGADSSIVGSTVNLSGRAYTILGVLPASYRHPEAGRLMPTQVFGPLTWTDPASSTGRYLRVLGRTRAGVTLDNAGAELGGIARQLENESPESNRGWGVILRPLRDELFGAVKPALLMVLGAAGFVLLIVCANVANLVLARSNGRRKEFAVRTALGAGRTRLAHQLVVEHVALSVAGGVLGLAVVAAGNRLLLNVQSQYISSVANIQIDGFVIAFTVIVSLATGVLFGLLPVFQASRADLRTPLTEESAGSGVTSSARRLRSSLVVAEIVLATVLVVGAGLMTRNFVSLIGVSPGFEVDGVLTFRVVLPRWRYQDSELVLAFDDQLLERVGALPGVRGVALVSDLPFTDINQFQAVNPLDQLRESGDEPAIEYRTVGPGYFSTMGIALMAGRVLHGDDGRQEGDLPVVVNETMAAQFWPNQSALGRRFIRGTGRSSPTATVVGIVADVLDDGFDSKPEARFYQPFAFQPQRGTWVLVRSSLGASAIVTGVRREIRALEEETLVSAMQPMADLVADTVADERMAMSLAGAFSLLAIALAGVGIYGVMTYAVGERRREIGIRGALGAQRSDVMRLVLGHAGTLTVLGTLGGLAVAIPLARLLEALLYDIRPTDPFTLAIAPVVLAGIALTASYVPAARATRIPPVEALRGER